MFGKLDYDGHERVVFAHDEATGLKAIIALHSTRLGPAFGGCRMWPYEDDERALTDALRLSRGMTYKAAICELPYGGGKSVIMADPAKQKTPQLLAAMGRLVESLGGRYIIADDVGTTLADIAVMRKQTRYTAGATNAAQARLAVTAYGVLMSMQAAVAHRFGKADFSGLRISVQGLGNVGMPLCQSLREGGAELIVADINDRRVAEAKQRFAAKGVAIEDIYSQDADIFAPCALGAVLNDQSIPRLRVKLICGGANNQLYAAHHDRDLADRGILFVPDYLASAGGVIDFYQEMIDDRPEAILQSVERIRSITRLVLESAKNSGRTALQVADRMVQQRLRAASTDEIRG
ncbi:MAG: amino acid dehydrogenase [Gammaproteobacteria bacterium]|jgi:leucine dehydrogenase|nr:amino acid dehydrogenase [Gammaproteobacteria bacterium]